MRLFSISIFAFLLLAPQVVSPLPSPVDVYAFRGMFGVVTSTGLDTLGTRLSASGHKVMVQPHWKGRTVLQTIIKSRQKTVALVCHSAGCITAKRMAFALGENGISVCVLATIDPVGSPYVSPNVFEALNWYQPPFGPLQPTHEFSGNLTNKKLNGYPHIVMDQVPEIHTRIAKAIKGTCNS